MTPAPLRLPISAALITRDAARTLDAALASVAFCDDVVVLDSGSSDDTVTRARAAGARVEARPWTGFRDQKNAAAALCRHDWVLSLDADEAVSAGLAEELRALVAGGRVGEGSPRRDGSTPAGYSIPRLSRYLGREIRHAGWYPDRAVRLYDRRRGRWVGGQVHERVEVDGPVARLRGDLLHDPYEGVAHHLDKMNGYTTLAAETMHARGKRAGWTDLTLRPAGAFVKKYVLQGGVLDGLPGLVVSASTAGAVFLKYAKLWDLRRRGAPRRAEAAADESPPEPSP